NRTNEAVQVLPLIAKRTGFEVMLPGQIDRTIIRYRILSHCPGRVEVVSPPATNRAEWHALFISPLRDSTNRCYDLFVSSNSLATLAKNVERSWKRGPNGEPPKFPTGTWDNSEPAIFVCNGVVYDVEMRHRGGMVHRRPERHSYKLKFYERQRF